MLLELGQKYYPMLDNHINDEQADKMYKDIEDFIRQYDYLQMDLFGHEGKKYPFLLDTRFYSLFKFVLRKNDDRSRDRLFWFIELMERYFGKIDLTMENWEEKLEEYYRFLDDRERQRDQEIQDKYQRQNQAEI